MPAPPILDFRAKRNREGRGQGKQGGNFGLSIARETPAVQPARCQRYGVG